MLDSDSSELEDLEEDMEFRVGTEKVAISRQRSHSDTLAEKVKLLTHLTLPPSQVTYDLLDMGCRLFQNCVKKNYKKSSFCYIINPFW